MDEAGAKIDFGRGKMSVTDKDKAPRVHSDSDMERTALTPFVQVTEGHSPQPCFRETRQTDVRFSASSRHEPTTDKSRTWLVKAKENITLARRC